MSEERGQLTGNQTFNEPIDFFGSVSGDVKVIDGGKVYVRGAIYGDLTVEHGGRVHIYGNVSCKLTVLQGAKVIVSGIIGADAINDGGRLYIDGAAKVLGKVRQYAGETKIDKFAQVRE